MSFRLPLLLGLAALSVAAAAWIYFSTPPLAPPPAAAATEEAPSETASALESAPSLSVPSSALEEPAQAAAEKVPHAPNVGPLTVAETHRLKALNSLLASESPALAATLAPLRAWAETDPAGAARWSLENLYGDGRSRALAEVFALWGAAAPEEALSWLKAQGSPEGLRAAYDAAFESYVLRDAPRAAEWLLQAGNRAPADAWGRLMSGWAQQDPAAALGWAKTSLPPERREAALAALAPTPPPPRTNLPEPPAEPALVAEPAVTGTSATAPAASQ